MTKTVSVEAQASSLIETANERVHQLPQTGGVHEHPMLAAAQALGLSSVVGTAAFVGRTASGEYSVQFNANNSGYSSAWPVWAYEVAKSALENGKRLWVGSNGDPFGSNLVFVYELA
jgi:hypothetical protein